MNDAGPNNQRLNRWGWLWVCLVVLAYVPSLSAGFLIYDDDWLYQHNPMLAPDAWDAPWAIIADFSRDTRLTLGAEYLPVRDLVAWLESRLFGLWAPGLHAVSLLLYLVAMWLFRGALLRCLGPSVGVELAALFFALHPVHAESVSWIAGQKDVLALCFVGAALYGHAGGHRRARCWVPVCVLLACLSKSMGIAVLGLLAAQDLILRRRPDWQLYAVSFASAGLAMIAHVYVGSLVGMVTAPLGGSRYSALISMGPVWLRYLELCLAPWQLSVVHDVPARTSWDLPAAMGTAFVMVSLAGAALALRRDRRAPAFIALWFFVPLLPVSQVLVPLQNPMADRYLWLSVMAPCLLVAWTLHWLLAQPRVPRALAWTAASGVAALLTAATFQRSMTFSSSVLLFADATRKTILETAAPYQLGMALEQEGREEEAMIAFGEVLRRAPEGRDPVFPKATNNLAHLLVKRGALLEAESVLRAGRARFPENPKLRQNLAKVLHRLGRHQEAEELGLETGP